MNKIPCENCIVLPMCKARLDGGDLINFLCLTDSCIPFQYYVYPSKDPKNQTSGNVREGITHLDGCIGELQDSLLKGITFDPGVDYDVVKLDGNGNPV